MAERRARPSLEGDARLLEGSLGTLPAPVARPVLLVLSGLPGSGKSYLRRELQKRHPLAALESDALRRVLFQPARHTQREHRRLFPAMQLVAGRLLGRGISVVYDATNLREAHREPLYRLAADHGAHLLVIAVSAPDEVIRKRLAEREARADPLDASDATVAVFEKMRPEAEPVARAHVAVDTSQVMGPVLDNIARELQAVGV